MRFFVKIELSNKKLFQMIYGVIMASIISVRLSDKLFQQMRTNAQDLSMSQTEYVRKAIGCMNAHIEELARTEKLKQASLRVRKESMAVNKEFSQIEKTKH